MTTETTPIWRQALNDEQHPLYRAAWLLFSKKLSLQYADRTLTEQKAQVIDFIYQILDADELYSPTSLGTGSAPSNGIELLGHWQVTDAIPRLLKILEDKESTSIRGKLAAALGQMGTAVFEPLLEFDQRTEHKHENNIAGIIADACKDDSRAYDYVRGIFEKQTDDKTIAFMGENLLVCDPKQAIPFLEEHMRQRKYSKDLKTRLESYITAAKKENFP